MLYNAQGNPVMSAERSATMRDAVKATVDGFQMPDGAIISYERSMALHARIVNDPILRERIEAADRQTGTTSMHLAVLRKVNKISLDDVVKNMKFGEKVQDRRVVEEKADLPNTSKAVGL
jgi:hypothetical protein